MAKVTVQTTQQQNRVSVNNQNRQTVRAIGIAPKVQGADNIAEMQDVDLTGLEDGEALVYDAQSGKFVPRTVSIIDGGTF